MRKSYKVYAMGGESLKRVTTYEGLPNLATLLTEFEGLITEL